MKINNSKTLEQILPGAVCKQWRKCGKSNCRCARGGQKHVQYCRFYRENGRLKQQYVKAKDLETVRAACAAHRQERQKRQAAQTEWRALFAMLKQYERLTGHNL